MGELLEILGRLSILSDDRAQIDIEFLGNVVVVNFPSVTAAFVPWRDTPRMRRRECLVAGQKVLAQTGLELRIEVKHELVACLGSESRTGWLNLLLGVDPLQMKIGGLVAAALGLKGPHRLGPATIRSDH